MPAMPKRIGIVTSPRGAALQDFLNILRRRHEDVHVLIYPAQVQGESAAAEVAAGIRYFNRAGDVDVIVIARGGGSAEDLASFNDEGLARAIAASAIPLVSAVGHETDFTIADFVADMRAPTPSAAAELVIDTKQRIVERVQTLHERLARSARYRTMMARSRWTELAKHSVFARMRELLNRRYQRTDELAYRLVQAHAAQLQQYRSRVDVATTRVKAHDLRRILGGMVREVDSATARLGGIARQGLLRQRARVEQAEGKLGALSPLNILERGYALVFDGAGNLVKDEAQVVIGDEITARLARGSVKSTVTKKSS
jgi:exodeoxyribonuclease VII large subunit